MGLSEQRMVVVGAGSGIGRAVALAASGEGARVVLVGRRKDALEETSSLLPRPAVTYPADVTNERDVEQLFETIGAFDHLVCTASQAAVGRLGDLKTDEIERAMRVKLWAPFFLVKHGRTRISRRGSFTFFSGIRGPRPTPGSSITAMVNLGLEGFARAMAVELGPIRVNVVSPGIVDSGAFWERLSADARTRLFIDYAAKAPARLVGSPADLAAAALFAASNPFVTGTVLNVDGGGVLV